MAQSIKRKKPIDSLVIHHTVVPGQEFTKEKAMIALNNNQYAYDGLPPYHYIIGNTWDYQGRPYDTIGYQAGSMPWNEISIGIALMGNFNNDTPTEHQKKRLGEVIKELMRVYKIPRTRVFLHKQVRPEPTACPGSKITQDFITKLLTTGPMPTCEQQLEQEKKDHAESILEKNVNYEKWQKALDVINSPTDGIEALRKQIAERDVILDQKRAEIIELRKQLELCQGLTPEQQADLQTISELKLVLKKLI